MRLFLALRFDSAMNKALTGVLHDLKKHGVKGNYQPAQNLHMTLVFIGETDRVQEVKEIIGSIPVPAFRLAPDTIRLFGDILLIDVKSNQKLKEYVAQVRRALDDHGIGYDHKKFMPHITLVRKASGGCKDIVLPKEPVTLQKVSLMKSVQKDGKMVYTEIAGWGKT